MSPKKISIQFRNDLAELDKLCQVLEKFGKSLGLSKKAIFQISLAMEEAF